MKSFKTEPDMNGLYLVIHKLKNGGLRIFKKRTDGRIIETWSNINVMTPEELEALKEALA